MLSSTFSCAAIFLTLCSYAIAAPLNNLEARTDCADGNPSPCICGGAKGIRKKTLQCGNQSFKFTDPASPTDGTVSLVPGNSGSLQCDHIVELQFIANEIDKVAAICKHFTSPAGKASFDTFFDTINAVPNLIFVESTVNNAKGIVFGGKSFVDTTSKAASGVVSYLKLLEANGAKNTNPGTHVATTIDTAMTTAVGVGNGFTSGFQSRWDAAVTAAIKTTNNQLPKLSPAPAPGDPFIDETGSTIAKCQRGLWNTVQSFVVRAIAGKATATASECSVAPQKTTAEPVAKPAVNPVAAKPATQAPVTKPATPVAAKPATKAPVKPVVKPVAAKPVVKPVAAKPAAKPAVKPVTKKPVKA